MAESWAEFAAQQHRAGSEPDPREWFTPTGVRALYRRAPLGIDQTIVDAVRSLGPGAYECQICRKVAGINARSVQIRLRKLVAAGVLDTWKNRPPDQRRGMDRRYYRIP